MPRRYIDTRNAELVRLDQLHMELESVEGYTHLLTGLDEELGHNVIEVIFDDEPTQEQKDAAATVIDAHVPGARDVRIHRFTGTSKLNVFLPPLEVDYTTGLTIGLYRNVEATDSFDAATEVVYYAEATQGESFDVAYSEPVVIERIERVRDETDAVRSTTTTISWLREDGTEHPTTKTLTRYA